MLLLANAPRSTKDIDIFWLDEDGLQRAYAPLRESVQVIKQKHDLDADWLNYLAQMLLYDEVIVPDGKLWKRFGPLHVYAPASEYILALKITAGRQKDLDDCAILLLKTTIRKNRHRSLQRSIPWRTPTNGFAREKTPGQPWEIFPTPGMATQSISDPTW